ncbi:MAG: hypothetical protein DMG04_02710 [Acidobacteria bacterium]|nr:MAG: hypothetical protein DMG04_02710 [Acidobacteriota bacterium]PYQ84492.1 MAG: hypothetical protein DMG02_31120 [Acidobacteriota bacterium]
MGHDTSSERPNSYERFFGFHQAPFSLAPDPRFWFQSASHAAALSQITYALERREPVVVVTGEIGTGKTLLCRTVLERLERKTFLSIVNDPLLERDDLLKQMLQDFGVLSKDRTVVTQTNRHDLIRALEEFLSSLRQLRAHAAVIIDEAQHVQPDVLEQIRLVSNIQDERGTMLQVILVGQTNLERLLSQPELRQLQQRVSRHVKLDPLSEPEVALYIGHRLAVARERQLQSNIPGAGDLERELAEWERTNSESAFTPEAVRAVAQLSRGIPRVVNLLCDRALEAAYERRSRPVDAALINAAAQTLDLIAAPQAAASTAAAEPASPATTSTEHHAPTTLDDALSTPHDAPVTLHDARGTLNPASTSPMWPELVTSPAPTRDEPRPTGGTGHVRRYAIVAASLALVGAALWLGGRALNRRGEGEHVQPPAAAVQPTTAPQAAPIVAAPSRDTSQPTASAAPAVTSRAPEATGTAMRSPEPAGEAVEIVVASFHTAARAADVAAQIAALGEPVRRRTTGNWQQVLAGPYASSAKAQDAQQRLARAGFTGTQVVTTTR